MDDSQPETDEFVRLLPKGEGGTASSGSKQSANTAALARAKRRSAAAADQTCLGYMARCATTCSPLCVVVLLMSALALTLLVPGLMMRLQRAPPPTPFQSVHLCGVLGLSANAANAAAAASEAEAANRERVRAQLESQAQLNAAGSAAAEAGTGQSAAAARRAKLVGKSSKALDAEILAPGKQQRSSKSADGANSAQTSQSRDSDVADGGKGTSSASDDRLLFVGSHRRCSELPPRASGSAQQFALHPRVLVEGVEYALTLVLPHQGELHS